jgi:predicted DNA-binding mobile mystery protein A
MTENRVCDRGHKAIRPNSRIQHKDCVWANYTMFRLMKRREIQLIRLKQLSERLTQGNAVLALPRPFAGWLLAIRQALGLSLKDVGRRLGQSYQAIAQAEKLEARGGISIKRLEAIAEAMGCRVTYAIVPKEGTLNDLADAGKRAELNSVQQAMSLEGQAVAHPHAET